MHLYMAAMYKNGYRKGCNSSTFYGRLVDNEKVICDEAPHVLESYHYVQDQKYVDYMRADGVKVFLDSGAFSAYTLGVSLSVEEYCEYIKRNTDIIRVEDGALMASVLDGIGDPLQTYRNQLEMEARGVRPLPCFHAGEDERYLEYYIANYEYITLGGMVGASSKQLMIWLDRIWSKYLTDGSGAARIKVHGFGITAMPIMQAYPWYSCDSSSWIQSTAFGGIITPKWGNLDVSIKAPSRKEAGRHLSTLTPPEQDVVRAHLEEAGFTYERLSEVYQSRAAYNVWSFGQINEVLNQRHRLSIDRQELF